MGGLSAAIHLRLKGFDVTLYEGNEQVGGRAGQIQADGFTFDTGPSLLNYPWVFEQLFAAAGRRLEDYVTLLPVDPSIRFHKPDGRTLELSSDMTRLVREFTRLDPGCGPGLAAFLADSARKYRLAFDNLVCENFDSPWQWFSALPPWQWLHMGVWRSLHGELKRFFRDELILDALGSYGMYLGGSPQQLPGLFSILPYGELAMGLWLPRGGIYGLVRGVEKLARELGVTIFTSRIVRQISVRDGAVAGLEFADGSSEPWSLVISNVDVPLTQKILLEGSSIKARIPRMTPAVMTFYWGVRGKVAGAGHHSIFLPRDSARAYDQLIRLGQVPDELPFYVAIASETDPSLAPPGDSTVFVLVPLPLPEHQEDWSTLAGSLKQRVLGRLSLHGVRLDPAAIAVERIMSPADWARRCGLYRGSAFGAAHTLLQMGYFRQPNREKRVRGLYYVGASTTPGTGLPMVALGGKMVAERIAADVR